MANEKLTDKTELTSVVSTDMLYVVDDPSGSPISKKATVDSVMAGFDHGARVYHAGSNQVLTTATTTLIAWDSEEKDTDAFHDTVTNNDRLTIPSGQDGVYLIGGGLAWEANATGQRIVRIYKNGTGGTQLTEFRREGVATYTLVMNVATMVNLVATDYVSLAGYQDSGGDLDAVKSSAGQANFWIQRIA